MSADPEPPPPPRIDPQEASRIYFLPNLMTAGNLFCGFVAVIRCIQANFASQRGDDLLARGRYEEAVWFILLAVVFDALDGRLARLGGRESLFGKEFDSIADIVSFGMAPALMVFFLILQPTQQYPFFREVGWLIGFLYLLCAAIRLARFNVITHPLVAPEGLGTKDFLGLPVPAAAGTIASMVFVLNDNNLREFALFLPLLLVLIAALMVSQVRYPSFKGIDWHTRTPVKHFVLLFVILALFYLAGAYAFCLMFLGYIFFGLARHFWSGRHRQPEPLGADSDD